MGRPEEILEIEALLSEMAERFAAIVERSGYSVPPESSYSIARLEFTSAAEDAAALICGTTPGSPAAGYARREEDWS